MKIILIIICGLFGVAQAQTTGYFRYDTTRFQKGGGNNEVIIENATRTVTGGVLTNTGGGRTAFVTPSGSTNTSIGSGYKFAVNGTNNIKSLYAVYGIILDSLTAGEVGIKVDSNAIKALIGNSFWKTTGNTGTTAGTNFIGTTDDVDSILTFY